MKYICFGHLDEKNWQKYSPEEQNAMMDECFVYDDQLRSGGHFADGYALDAPQNAATIRYGGGKVTVTDGPFTESKEILGGLLILEARDLNHAIQLISNHPGVKMGAWEIRPTVDLAGMIKESEERRARAATK
jgi:hypothetical protein